MKESPTQVTKSFSDSAFGSLLSLSWSLPVGVKPTYCHVPLASQLHCETTGRPTGKSPLWLDNYLHKLEEISTKRNPALASMQKAYFRKSVHGHFVVKTERERDTAQEKRQIQVEKRQLSRAGLGWDISSSRLPYLLCLDHGSWGPGLCPGTLTLFQCSSAAHTP